MLMVPVFYHMEDFSQLLILSNLKHIITTERWNMNPETQTYLKSLVM